MRSSWLLFAASVAAACGSSQSSSLDSSGTLGAAGAAGGAGAMGGAGGGHPAGSTGLPCAVEQLLATRCLGCHDSKPAAGTPMSLVTYDDLTKPSKTDPAKSNAALSVDRMSATNAQMPPSPLAHATGGEIAVMADWVNAGLPKQATCAGAGGAGGESGSAGAGGKMTNPYDTPTVCSSNLYWDQKTAGWNMAPGEPCVACHMKYATSDAGKYLSFAGTVYKTAHEPDDCYGVGHSDLTEGPATIEITGADGMKITFTVDLQSTYNAGNFATPKTVKMPYTARVLYGGRERIMKGSRMSPDCNGCHTEKGTTTEVGGDPAPGRIMLP